MMRNKLLTPSGFPWAYGGSICDSRQGFFLNGQRLQLQGTAWFQSYPGLGNAVPNSRRVKDMEIIRDMGVNFFRTSVMDACEPPWDPGSGGIVHRGGS
jgi:beta-galactosidase